MFYTGYDSIVAAAEKKIGLYRSDKIAYSIASILAGVYVGICMITILVMASQLPNFGGLKILQGVSFAAALSLIFFAGAELFTGNLFVMLAGVLRQKVIKKDAVGLIIYCYLGNFVGSILIAVVFWWTGYLKDLVLEESVNMIYAKTAPLFGEIFARGILCNMLVCAGAWCYYRMENEVAKLVMIFWAIYLFVVCGFEHSIANMTLFSLGTIAGAQNPVPMLLMLKNLLAASVGNMVGGLALSYAYWMLTRSNTKSLSPSSRS